MLFHVMLEVYQLKLVELTVKVAVLLRRVLPFGGLLELSYTPPIEMELLPAECNFTHTVIVPGLALPLDAGSSLLWDATNVSGAGVQR